MLPSVNFTLARSTYIDIIADRVHPLKAMHATNTIQELLEKRQRARGFDLTANLLKSQSDRAFMGCSGAMDGTEAPPLPHSSQGIHC